MLWHLLINMIHTFWTIFDVISSDIYSLLYQLFEFLRGEKVLYVLIPKHWSISYLTSESEFKYFLLFSGLKSTLWLHWQQLFPLSVNLMIDLYPYIFPCLLTSRTNILVRRNVPNEFPNRWEREHTITVSYSHGAESYRICL